MNGRPGFWRLWIIGAALWVVLAALGTGDLLQIVWHPDKTWAQLDADVRDAEHALSACRAKPLPQREWNDCELRERLSMAARGRLLGGNVFQAHRFVPAVLIGPPLTVLGLGLLLAWMARGFDRREGTNA